LSAWLRDITITPSFARMSKAGREEGSLIGMGIFHSAILFGWGYT
jgi:hypothetical protein